MEASVKEQSINDLSSQVIGAAIEVHKALGPGLLESAYEECLCRELSMREIEFERQRQLPIEYKGVQLDCGYRIDLLVDTRLLLELKSVDSVTRLQKAQIMTYMKLLNCELGLLLNFNVAVLTEGITRVSMGAPNL